MASIKKQLLSGSIYLAIAKYAGILVNLIVIAILARLISPSEFALVAIITVISNFFILFSDFGIAAAIIQNQDLTSKDYSNLFSYCFYIGLIISIIFFVLSYILADLYDSVTIGSLSKLLVIQIFFSALNIVPNALILKRKEFNFIALRTVLIHICTGALACIAAYNGLGIFSLLINPLLSSVLIFLFNYIRIDGLRLNLCPQFKSLKIVLGYSLYNLGYNIINYFSRNSDKLIIGKVLPLEQLGYYEKSYSIMMLPVQNVISIINPVIHPILSKYQNDEVYIFNMFKKSVSLFAWIGFPLGTAVHIYGSYIIKGFLGDTWLQAIPTFKIFALSIGFQLIYSLQGPFFLIRNNPKTMMYCGIFTAVINIVSLFIGLYFLKNIMGIALMISLSYVITLFVTFYYLMKTCFRSFRTIEIINQIFPSLLYSTIILTICCSLNFFCVHSLIIIISISIIFALTCLYKIIRILRVK